MTNREIARILHEIAIYLEIQGIVFKPQAYRRVAVAVEELNEPINEIYEKGGLKTLEKTLRFLKK